MPTQVTLATYSRPGKVLLQRPDCAVMIGAIAAGIYAITM